METTALKGWFESVSAKLPEKQWRRLAGGGLVGLIVLTGGSVLLRKRSIEAYTTADVVSVCSPIQGVVKQQNRTAGEQLNAGEMLLDIEASRNDASKLASTTLKLRQTEAELMQSLRNCSAISRSMWLALKARWIKPNAHFKTSRLSSDGMRARRSTIEIW